MTDSYVKNCILHPRKDEADCMFKQLESGIYAARLDGYAIIPVEEYNRLKTVAGE